MVRFLPGIVVQKQMSVQGMAVLYKTKPDILARLIKSTTIGPPSLPDVSLNSPYSMDGYLVGLLQNRDRSHLYYCEPMLQHILFADISCLYWVDAMPLTFSRRFSAYF